jgi:acyl phosphate:glycerol-3-phosphate acyltransferase
MIALLIKGALSYLLGSLVGSLVLRRYTGVDIRSLGSGNAGATNALRTLGRKVALLVLVIDIVKGSIATALIARWSPPGIVVAPELSGWSVTVCGLAVILGHVYPLWYGLRGGKGLATLLGAVAGINAWLLLPMLLTWLAAVILFGFVGLASVLGTIALAATIALTDAAPPLLAFGILAALLVVFTHRGNIARMRAGTEPRARRLWLLGARRGAS